MEKTKNNYYLIFGLCWVTFMVALALGSVGNSYEAGVYTYKTPIGMLFLIGSTFAFGYFAGDN